MDVHTPQQPDTSCIYAVVQAVECGGIRIRRPDQSERRISFMGGDIATGGYLPLLQPGNNLYLLDSIDDGTALHPRFIVVEPDFLIDVSLLAECCRSFGHLWQLYLPTVYAHAISTDIFCWEMPPTLSSTRWSMPKTPIA